jgi:hypothetical protein
MNALLQGARHSFFITNKGQGDVFLCSIRVLIAKDDKLALLNYRYYQKRCIMILHRYDKVQLEKG